MHPEAAGDGIFNLFALSKGAKVINSLNTNESVE